MTTKEHLTLFAGLRALGSQTQSLLQVELTPDLQAQLAAVWPLAGTDTFEVEDYQPTAGDGFTFGPTGTEIKYLAGTWLYLCKLPCGFKLATEADLWQWLQD